MKKLVLLSHCVLNSFCELPEASDAIRSKLMNQLMDKGISVIQLPCPELCYQALERESILPGDSGADAYRDYCKSLLAPILKNLQEYKKHNIQVAAVIGIDTSPSCSVIDPKAIMMELLLKEMKEKDITAGCLLDMPLTEDTEAFFKKIEEL